MFGNALLGTFAGIAAAMTVSGLLGLLLAWLGIRHKVDQIIAGTVIYIGAIGITNFLFLRFLCRNTEFNAPPTRRGHARAVPVRHPRDRPDPLLVDARTST